jgi:hypothetical protein
MAGSQAALAFASKTTDSGAPVKWASPSVVFQLNEAGSDDLSFETTRRAVKASFDQWNDHQGCDLTLKYGGSTPEAAVGYLRDGDNTNLVVFEDDEWPFDSSALAVTLTTFNTRTGELLDADIIINGADYTWGNGTRGDQHDLANSLTHEVGHFIGLEHSDEMSATMFPSASPGEIAKRDLDLDDIAGLASLYGTGEDYLEEDPASIPEEIPVPSVDSESGVRVNDAQVHLACASATPSSRQPGGPWFLLFLAAVGIVAAIFRNRRERVVAVLVAGACMVCVPFVVHAGQMQALSLDEMVAQSEKVVVADVVAQASAFENGVIWTHTWLRVSECLSGHQCQNGEEVLVRTPGGTVGDIRQEVSGVTVPQTGQTLVLFLRRVRGTDTYSPVGMGQGVLSLEWVRGAPWAVHDLSGTNLAHRSMTLPLAELRGHLSRGWAR